jgi:hypothetical protein
LIPLSYFQAVWSRCAELEALHTFLAKNTTSAISTDELLRAEWVARVSALDLYLHELIAQNMLAIFERRRATTKSYEQFQLPNKLVQIIQCAETALVASSAFDLEIRNRLSYQTYQDPEKIAEGIRLISHIELWNEIAIHFGATESNKIVEAKKIKSDLSLIVQRRNKIAHEGDLQPSFPRSPWTISRNDLADVRAFIEKIVLALDKLA